MADPWLSRPPCELERRALETIKAEIVRIVRMVRSATTEAPAEVRFLNRFFGDLAFEIEGPEEVREAVLKILR